MRRATLTVVALALLLSLGIGVLVGRMAGGGSGEEPDQSLVAATTTVDQAEPAGSPFADPMSTPLPDGGSPTPPFEATD